MTSSSEPPTRRRIGSARKTRTKTEMKEAATAVSMPWRPAVWAESRSRPPKERATRARAPMLMPKKSEKVKNIRKLEMPAAARASAPRRPASAVLIMNSALCIRFSSIAGQPSAKRRRRIWGRGSWGWPATGDDATARRGRQRAAPEL